jgi:hypothetical protein
MIAGFINILCFANNIQIIYINWYNAKSYGGSFDEDAWATIVIGVSLLQKVLTQPVVPHSSRLFQTIE